jgi:cytoskeleton protein RodZ
MAVARGSEESGITAGDGETKEVAAPALTEPTKAEADADAGLGATLVAARERRGKSCAEVAAETRIPFHYLQMLEGDDYGRISDQLYLLPFLRRYAAFLGLDGEEIGMRFVREVQRAEGAVSSRMSEPLEFADNRLEAQWIRIAAAAGIATVIVVLYFMVARRHRAEAPPPPAALTAPVAPAVALAPSVVAPSAASAAQTPPAFPDASIASVPSSTSASTQRQASLPDPPMAAGRNDKPAKRNGR